MRKRTFIRKVFSVIKSSIWDSLLQIYYKETLYLPFICWQQWSILLLLCTQLLNIAHSEHDMKIPFHCIIHSCLNILLNMHLTYNQGVTTMCQSNAQFQDVYRVLMYWIEVIIHDISQCSLVFSKVNFCFNASGQIFEVFFKSAETAYQLIWTSFAVFHWREMGYRKMIMSYTMAWHRIYWIRKENCSTR